MLRPKWPLKMLVHFNTLIGKTNLTLKKKIRAQMALEIFGLF